MRDTLHPAPAQAGAPGLRRYAGRAGGVVVLLASWVVGWLVGTAALDRLS